MFKRHVSRHSIRTARGVLVGLAPAVVAACANAPTDSPREDTASSREAISVVVPPLPITTFYPIYTGKVRAVDPTAPDQTPTVSATAHVPLHDSGTVSAMNLKIELDPATVRVNGADITLPWPFTGDFDEVSITLVAPSGKQIRVADPVALRYRGGALPDPLPLSSYDRLKAVVPAQPLEVYRPVVGDDGLPLLDSAGNTVVRSVTCNSLSWIQDAQAPSRIFPRCPTANVSSFKSTYGSDLRFASKTMNVELDKEVAGEQAYGDWTLIVTDARPLQNDTLPASGSVEGSGAKPLVSRFAIKSFSMWPITDYAPVPPTRTGTRAFANEVSVDAPIKDALKGTTWLVASGVRMDAATVWYKIKRRTSVADPAPAIVLYSNQGGRTILQRGFDDDVFHEIDLGTSAAPFPDGAKGTPVDGLWALTVSTWDSTSQAWRDVSADYDLDWGMKVSGPLTEYVAVQELDTPVTVNGSASQTLSFDVQAGDRVAADVWLEPGTDNLWAFRHRFTITAPTGAVVGSCAAGQDPVNDGCLRVDSTGKTVRIALPSPVRMTGRWTVRWDVDHDAASAAADMGVHLVGACAPTASATSLVQATIGARLRAASVTLYGMKLGLSETRLSPGFFAFQVMDAAEARPRHTFMIGKDGKQYSYNVERVRLDRDFLEAYQKAVDASPSSTAIVQDLSQMLDAAMGSDNLRRYSAIEDAMYAAWAPRGQIDVYAGVMHSYRTVAPTFDSTVRLSRADLGIRLAGGAGRYADDSEFPLTEGLVRWIGSFNDGSTLGALKTAGITVALTPILALVPLVEDAAHGGVWGPFIQMASEPKEKSEAEKTEESNAKADDESKDGTTKEDEDAKPETTPPPKSGEMCPDYAYECSSSQVSPIVTADMARLERALGFWTMHSIAPYALCQDGPCGIAVNPGLQPSWLPVTDPTTPYINCGSGASCANNGPGATTPSVCWDWLRNKGFTDPAPFVRVPGVPVLR